MAAVSKLKISRIRNIGEATMLPDPDVNIICGDNGSGKTSILEAIYLAAIGRSFRSSRITPLIQYEAKSATVFIELANGSTVGLRKSRNERPELRLNGSAQTNWLDIARLMPVQVIESNTFRLMEGSPSDRRRFLDWGVFHVEPTFSEHWRNVRKCIEQRNLLLKSSVPNKSLIRAWTTELARESANVDSARSAYFQEFLPIFSEVLHNIGEIEEISMEYRRGWSNDRELLEELYDTETSDIKAGFTQKGPHRADLVVKAGTEPANDALSRGQQKIVVNALKLAQGKLQAQTCSNKSIFLIDDLPAELDSDNRGRVCRYLRELDCQIFITSVDAGLIENSFGSDKLVTKFHVKHGKIKG